MPAGKAIGLWERFAISASGAVGMRRRKGRSLMTGIFRWNGGDKLRRDIDGWGTGDDWCCAPGQPPASVAGAGLRGSVYPAGHVAVSNRRKVQAQRMLFCLSTKHKPLATNHFFTHSRLDRGRKHPHRFLAAQPRVGRDGTFGFFTGTVLRHVIKF